MVRASVILCNFSSSWRRAESTCSFALLFFVNLNFKTHLNGGERGKVIKTFFFFFLSFRLAVFLQIKLSAMPESYLLPSECNYSTPIFISVSFCYSKISQLARVASEGKFILLSEIKCTDLTFLSVAEEEALRGEGAWRGYTQLIWSCSKHKLLEWKAFVRVGLRDSSDDCFILRAWVVPLRVMFIARAAKSETLLMFNLKREWNCTILNHDDIKNECSSCSRVVCYLQHHSSCQRVL